MERFDVVTLSPEEIAVVVEIEKAKAGLPTVLDDIPECILKHKVGESMTLEYMRTLNEFTQKAILRMKQQDREGHLK